MSVGVCAGGGANPDGSCECEPKGMKPEGPGVGIDMNPEEAAGRLYRGPLL